MIKDCKYEDDGKTISWKYQGLSVKRKYDFSVYFVVSKNDDYIVIVEPDSDFSPDNAVIFNPDGSERKRIINPCRDKGALCFGDIYYVSSEITLISICRQAYYACVLDLDGNVIRVYESR